MLARDLGEFISTVRCERLPSGVIGAAKIRILDLLGAGLAGVRLGTPDRLLRLLESAGQASVWGSEKKLSVRDAALVNSFAAHSTYLEDGSRYTGGHPSSVVIPAAIALAEARHASGEELIAAVVAGYETFLRLGRSIYPSTVIRGFQSTAVLGAVASAAATANLLRLTPQATADAIAIACNLGAGLKEALKSSDSQPLQVGRSCEGGILAALFAQEGARGAEGIIENGFLRAFAGEAAVSGVGAGLGSEFRIFETYMKLHAGCRGNHAPIDAVLDLVKAQRLKPDEIERIKVQVDSVTLAAAIEAPRDGNQAQFSIGFSVAVGVLDGHASVFQYTDRKLADPRVRAMMRRITVEVDRRLDAYYPDKRGAVAEILVADGRRLTNALENAKGEPESPLSEADIMEKFMTLSGEMLGSNAETVRDMVMKLEKLPDVGSLADKLKASSRSPVHHLN